MTELIFDLIRNTAQEIEPPVPYGSFHLSFFIIGGALAVVLALILSRVGWRGGDILIFTTGVILLLGETYKQLFYPAVEGAYRFDLFPFQLCSVPMYLCLCMPFIHNERINRTLCTFMATYGLLGGISSYISPATMCRPYLSLSIHSFLWHLLLIFIGLWLIFSRRTTHRMRDFADAVVLYLALCAVAFAINLCLYDAVPEVNMFYLGPHPSPLPVCRDVTARFGVLVNSVFYISVVTLGASLVHAAVTVTTRIIERNGQKK